MSAKNIVGAEVAEKHSYSEKKGVSIVIYVNVIFSLLNNNGGRKKSDKGRMDTTDIICAMADVIKEHPCYHASTSVEENPDKIYAYECYVPCQDLFFNDKGECIDTIGSYSKILYACTELDNYFKEQVFPIESKIQVCINAIGFEAIEDIVWGFAFMADACCPNNIEDELLNEWIMDEYEPFFLEYIKKGWKINVTYISLLESGIVYEVYDKNQLSTKNTFGNDNRNGENSKKKNINFEKKENARTKKESDACSSYEGTDATDADIFNNIEKEPSLKLEGYISKTEINLSSFFSLDHILDTIPPYNAIRFLDRLTGVDKIEERIRDKTTRSIEAFMNGNSERGWGYLKEAGGASLDYIHKRLDVLAFFPGVGSVAGVVDGVIYTVQEGFAFNDGDLIKGEELKIKALKAYAGAIPIYKIFRYAKPVLRSGRAITEGSKRAIEASKNFQRAENAYQDANAAKKALRGAIKAVRKPAISNRSAMKKARRDAEWALNKARNDPQYVNALEEYGIKYEDAIRRYRVTFSEMVRVLNGKKTPVADFVQTFLLQTSEPDSATSEFIRNVSN